MVAAEYSPLLGRHRQVVDCGPPVAHGPSGRSGDLLVGGDARTRRPSVLERIRGSSVTL
jgi:hypothetical protein